MQFRGIAAVLLALVTLLGGCAGTTVTTTTVAAVDLPIKALSSLPPQAAQTLALIERGGPFPYRRDGVTFENRERRLPVHERGYYREYTVPTPGRPDRGARRLVTGREHEVYYTGDHYRTFVVVDVNR